MRLDISDLLKVPYKEAGRDKKGFDCYGLVIEVSKRLGHELVDFTDEERMLYVGKRQLQGFSLAEKIIEQSGLIKTDEPIFGDIILVLNNKRQGVHIGVMLDNEIIHCDMGGVRISPVSDFKQKEFYTWK